MKLLVDYVEKVAVAVAVRTTKARNRFISSADFSCYFAFFGFGGFFEKHFHDFCCVIVEEVVDVPELAFLFTQMPGYSLMKVGLCGANVSIQAFCEMPSA